MLYYTYLSILTILLFFFNDTAPTEIYTLSLHDALPICQRPVLRRAAARAAGLEQPDAAARVHRRAARSRSRSEEHTSELQSLTNLVCRLLLEKKKKYKNTTHDISEHIQVN